MTTYLRLSALITLLVIVIVNIKPLQAQQTSQHYLQQMQKAQEAEEQYLKEKQRVDSLAERYNLEVRFESEGRIFEIMRFENNRPIYYATDNVIAQQTIAVDEVHPGGVTGYDLTGEGVIVGEWDGGGVRSTHQEFEGRVNQKDGVSGNSGHATHVAGIMIAAGVRDEAEGMSYNANLWAHDWGNASSEMRSAAADGLVASNHSYGTVVGWGGRRSCKDGSDEEFPVWHGNPSISPVEEYRFGFYTNSAENWDRIAHDNPHYLIVKSAGNDRGNPGPSDSNPGHCVYNGGWQYSEVDRQADGGEDGYDSMGSKGNAKNILAVGAVRDIPGGYEKPSDVRASGFTSFGPPDDGRVKPDVVGNGVGLLSPNADGDDTYARLSGTSMSAPNVTGAIGLLHEYYKRLNGDDQVMRASTVKSLLIQTTNEAGNNPGPDYKFGWGLVNIRQAADIIKLDNKLGGTVIQELTLNEGDTLRVPVEVSPNEDEMNITVGWTDPAGDSPSPQLDPSTKMLVNDVDMKLIGPNGNHHPWKLDRDNPSAAATRGENDVDNTEKITVFDPSEGSYIVQITHEGSLRNGSQKVSLILDRGAGERYDISGEVTIQSNSEPAAGVKMYLSGFSEDTVVTDSTGNFTFYGQYNGDYTIEPAADGITFDPSSQNVIVDGNNVTGVNFTANTPGYRNITLRLNTATLSDTLQPNDTLQVRGNIAGTSDGADQLPDGNVLSWDAQSTLTMQEQGGDYWELQFQIPEMETVNFKFHSAQNENIVGGLETGTDHQIKAAVGHKTMPLHYYEQDSETDHPYKWLPWQDNEGQIAVQFRIYLPESLNPIIVGIRGDDLNGDGPLRVDQPRVDVMRETSDDTKPGYRLYSGVGHYDTTLAGKVQEYKFKFELSDWEEAKWRTFTVPDQDTTLHWTYPNNALPVVSNDEYSMMEDSSIVFNPVENDNDPEGGPLRIDSLRSLSNGTATVMQDSLINFEPDSNYSGRVQFYYIVEDIDGATAEGRIRINVENINDAPERPSFVRPEDSITVQISGEWDDTFEVEWDSVYDADGDQLSYHWELTEQMDFASNSLVYNETVQTDLLELRYATLDSVLSSMGVNNGQTILLNHRVVVDDGTVQRVSDTLSTYFERGTITSLSSSRERPEKYQLGQNYPNPFNPSTTIRYSIPGKAHVEITVYNTLGQEVTKLVNKTMGAGSYQTTWDAGKHNSGMYLYRLKAGDYTKTKSMILLK